MEMDNRSVRLNKKSNLLKLDEYMYPLVDTDKPNVFRNLFPYEEVPKIAFNDRIVPHEMPEDIWITDTTFRDGQQSRTPFVGKNFNVTRAGIHADGLLKNEEIYNIFDTDKLLNRPVLVAVSNTSGLAGIAHWMNTYYRLKGDKAVDKKSPLVEEVKKWVDKEYETGRVTAITDSELEKVIKESSEKLGINF